MVDNATFPTTMLSNVTSGMTSFQNTTSWLPTSAVPTTDSYVTTAIDVAMTTMNTTFDFNGTTPNPPPPFGTCLYFLSDEQVQIINDKVKNKNFIPALVLTILMFMVGIPGNTLVFYVYWKKWRKTTSRVFIMALAAFDLCNCVSVAFEIHIILNVIQYDLPGQCKFSRMFTFMMNNASSFTLLVIAMDRFMRICRPLKPCLSNRQAKQAVALAVLMSVVFSFPAAVLYGTETRIVPLVPKKYVCLKMHLCLIEDGYGNTSYPLIFTSVLLAGNLLIDLVLIVCYSCIAYQVVQRGQFNDGCLKGRQGSVSSTATDHEVLNASEVYKPTPIVLARQASLASSSGGEKPDEQADTSQIKPVVNGSTSRPATGGGSIRSKLSVSYKRSQFKKNRSLSTQSIESRRAQMYKTTLMLFLVTLLFMISFIPYCCIVIIRYIQPNYYALLTDKGKAIFQFFLRTYLLSSALNPVIYSFMSQQFRIQCRNLFKKMTCFKRKFSFNSTNTG